MRIDRMLAITVLLLNRERVSAKELAEKFEVSVRTVYRDIDAINMAGIPVISFPGNNGGFGIMPNYRIDRQLLTFDSMVSILSALKGVNNTLGDEVIDGAIEKFTSLVPPDKADDLRNQTERIIMDILPWGYTKRQRESIRGIHEALASNRLIEFEYFSYRGEGSKRIVEPITLIFKGYAWYLFAFCRLRSAYRLFRLSRIRNMKLLDTLFQRREKSYRDYETETEKQSRPEIELKLKFHPDAKSRVEDMFADEDIKVDEKGNLLVTVVMPEDDWIVSFVLSFGSQLEILAPLSVRQKVAESLKLMCEKYN